ncbi:cytosolic carboxypeptidase 3-like [Mus pahari]|uniref:cytosolic carboxypeptidase 3-like n=1 Tax=Mus pahari TaxID=10093 RepID=UPI000A30DFA3|nr:cytosolic carboxypeptidase 3-like [Mus pahari]
MSEDSEEEDYSDRSISDDDELDEDSFMKFVSDDIHPCTLLAADSIGDPFFPRTTQILLEYQLGRWVPRLRGPRDLYGVSSSGPLSPTRWPYHCEVIDEKVQHIGMFLEVWGIQTLANLSILMLMRTLCNNCMKYNISHMYK